MAIQKDKLTCCLLAQSWKKKGTYCEWLLLLLSSSSW